MQIRTAWEKATWSWNPLGEREAGDSIVRNLLLHWFPAKVSLPSLSFRYSLWLGTVAATLFFLLTVTGVALMFVYVPSVERAYLSVKDIEFVTSYGWFIRGVHRIAAHLMVAVVVLHMARAFLTGAFKNGFGNVQNHHRCGHAADHSVPFLYRLPAALGSARLLGGDGGHQHCACRAGGGRRRALRAVGRPPD